MKAKNPQQTVDNWRRDILRALAHYEALLGKPCPCQRELIEAKYQRAVAQIMADLLRK